MSFVLTLPVLMLWLAGAGLGDGPGDHLLIKLASRSAPGAGDDALAALNRDVGAVEMRRLFRDPPRGHRNPSAWQAIGLDRWYRIELGRDRHDIDGLVARYAALAQVERAERDRYVLPIAVPNDPDYLSKQWDLRPNRTDAEGAWDVITDSSSLVVFVVDTGVEVTHSDISSNLWQNPGEVPNNGVDDEGNGFIDDINGWDFVNDDKTVEDDWPHGMHVNGIIGATGNNAKKVAGINWKCRLAQGKMFGNGFGTWEFGAA